MSPCEKRPSAAKPDKWGRHRFNAQRKAPTPPPTWQNPEPSIDPNDLIDSIVDAIDYAEIAQDTQGLVKARRLLNNDLRQAIDSYIEGEVERTLAEKTLGL